MNDPKTTTVIDTPANEDSEAPVLMVRIGNITYRVRIHFSTTSKETMSDKIKRLLRNEVQQA